MRSASSDACATWGLSRKACLKEPDEPMMGGARVCECPLLHGRLRLGINGCRPASKLKLVGRCDNRLD